MALTATISKSIQLATQYQAVSGSEQVVDGLVQQLDNLVDAGNNETWAVAFDKDKVKTVFAVSNVAGNLTFQRTGNASEVPVELIANKPYEWSDGYFACPFGNNIANVKFENLDGNNTVARVQMIVVIDPT